VAAEEDSGASAEVMDALAQRQAALEAARTRVLWIFVAASLASAFLVGQVLPFGALTLAGAGCYAAIGMATVLAFGSQGERNALRPPKAAGANVDGPIPPSSDELSAIESRLARIVLLGQICVVLLVIEILAAGINASRLS